MKRPVIAHVAIGAAALALAFGPVASANPGDLDPTFGLGGVVRTHIGYFDTPNDLGIQPDGKIIATGTVDSQNGNRNVFVVRYLADGSMDMSFGTGGMVVPDRYHQIGPRLALQPDNKIVLATRGETIIGPAFLYRFGTDGTPDSTFDADGIATMSTTPGVSINGVMGVCVLPSGKIVVCLRSDSLSGKVGIGLARFNADGTPDSLFGSGGYIHVPHDDLWIPLALGLQADGRMLVAGYVFLPGAFVAEGFVARFEGEGTLDAGFGEGGVAIHPPTTNSTGFFALDLTQDGSILAGGFMAKALFGQNEWLLTKFTPAGSLDQAFGLTGSTVYDPASGDDILLDLSSTPAGIYAAGSTQNGLLGLPVALFTEGGSLDPQFGSGGIAGLPGQHTFGSNRIALQADGKIIAYGTIQTFEPVFNQDVYLARYVVDSPTGVELALVSAEARPQCVRLSWCGAQVGEALHVERAERDGAWIEVGTTMVEGTGCAAFEDRAVVAGKRYAYRLAYQDGGGLRHSVVSWVDVPNWSLALAPVRPNPTRDGDAWVSLTLPRGAPAKLDLHDVTGRLVRSFVVGEFGEGAHAVHIGGGLNAGLYWLRLHQAERTMVQKIVVVH